MTEMVNHPAHYQSEAGIEVIDVIEQYGLGFHLGNAIKYLLRAGRKADDEHQELAKARWYLERWQSGISERHGVEYGCASDDTEGGVCWQTPEAIADAFSLIGERRTAAVEVLSAACFGDDEERIGAAIDALNTVLVPA